MTSLAMLASGIVVGAVTAVLVCLWLVARFTRDKSQICHVISGFCTGLTINGAGSLRVFIDSEPTLIPLRALAQAFANGDLLTHEPVSVERPAIPPPPPRDFDGRA